MQIARAMALHRFNACENIFGDSESAEAPILSLPALEAPLYNNLLDRLSSTGDEHIMKELSDLFFVDKTSIHTA